MHMDLQRITKQNIVRTTGLPISSLLEQRPVRDARLEKLQRKKAPENEDMQIRGNPQLTIGRTTPLEAVDAYFEEKKRKAGGERGY